MGGVSNSVGGRLNWHLLFGLVLTDYFEGTGYRVELEMGLSVRHQMLDVVVVRAEDGARLADGLPAAVRLFAVTTRHPKALERRFGLEKIKPGVYNLPYGLHAIRGIALRMFGRRPATPCGSCSAPFRRLPNAGQASTSALIRGMNPPARHQSGIANWCWTWDL